MERAAVVFLYNLLMLTALSLLSPVWAPWMILNQQRRRTFCGRLAMSRLAGQGRGRSCAAAADRIWIHALSVGEVLSAQPLVAALAKRYGPERLVFTASTRTGFETAARVIAPAVGALRYFPYDTLFSVNRALAVVRPRQVVFVETDIWPNFLYRLSQHRIPVCLVNARLSDRSFKGYRRLGFFVAPLLSRFARICVQTDADRRRFRALGVADGRLVTVGNIKFDQCSIEAGAADRRVLAQQLRLPADRPVWVAGSTHPGEEALLADTCCRLGSFGLNAVLIVAPRDPNRADEVCGVFNRLGLDARRLGQIDAQQRSPAVVVIDRIGLLRRIYALTDVAFVGGSLVKAGGHNPLEPAAAGKPVLFGPHSDDFRWVYQALEKAGGAICVADARQLAEAVRDLMRDPERKAHLGRCARNVFLSHRGAVARTVTEIEKMTHQGGQDVGRQPH